ncbi:MAG: hypothetical protein HW421_2997 [Ignavibacteria bacterium]|nr:hypothetical protein [Ignavibacteria bacterium]
MPNEFKGLKPAALKFFKDLAQNNNKEWFTENKHIYENEVKEPLKAMVSELGVLFANEGLSIIADPKKAMFRINRDIRFSPDKSPYKTHAGVFLPYTLSQTNVKPVESLGLYYHFEPAESFIAAGIHSPLPPILKSLREHIAENWQEFDKIINLKSLKKEFPTIYESGSLKTMPRGFPSDHPAGKYLKMKEFTVFCEIQHKNSYSPELTKLMITKARAAKPFMDFLLSGIK